MGETGSERSVGRRVSFGVGSAEVGASLTFVTINTWLLYYLVNVAHVDPLLAGGVFVAGRVVDAVTDPLMGLLSDRVRPRVGRLVFVRWGALPLGVGFAVLWWAPAAAGEASAVVALGALVASSLLYTVVQMPTLALTPDLAAGYDARTRLTSVRVAFAVIASMVAVALPPLIVVGVAGGGTLAASAPAGWAVLGLLFGGVATASYLVLPALVREPPAPRASGPPAAVPGGVGRGAGRPPPWTVFGAPGFGSILVVFLVVTVALMMVNSMLPFALETVLRLTAESQTVVLGCLFGSAILSFPLWNAWTARHGKRSALSLGALVMGGALWALVATSPAGAVGASLLTWTAIAGVGLASVMATPWAMLPDVVEFDALRSGAHREGLIYAVFTFVQKLAGSLGVFANAVAATLFGYVPGVAAQAPRTVAGFALVLGPVAFGLFALAAALVWTSPVTRASHARARDALLARSPPAASDDASPREGLDSRHHA